MKNLFIATGVFESVTGILLLISPAIPISILLNTSVDSDIDLLLGRLVGVALLTLGIACWFARNDEKSPAASGLAKSMFLYNIGALTLLVYARLVAHLSGIGLWPAVFLHFVLAVWCIKSIGDRKIKE